MSITPQQVEAGQAIYTKRTLAAYDERSAWLVESVHLEMSYPPTAGTLQQTSEC
ncbi:hypothetical protein [Gloeothece verrucosa]|uniref:hypothetical protein n=1 Tax=Gloeothece verrucosa TaxID=2546359 RepID=UPI00315C8515